jgi:hypothetical protein
MQWPTSFVQVYLNDAIDKRMWVDLPQSSMLVTNILTAFPGSCAQQPLTSVPKPLAAKPEPDPKRRKTDSSPTMRAQPAPGSTSQSLDEESFGLSSSPTESNGLPAVRPRFRGERQQHDIHGMVMEAMRLHVDVPGDLPERKAKSVLRLLPLLLGYEAVRRLVAEKIESWMNSPNVARFTRDLLPRLANECTMDDHMEQETMRRVVQIKYKVHAAKEHMEVIAILARTNVHFCQLALEFYLREETVNADSLAAKILKYKQ